MMKVRFSNAETTGIETFFCFRISVYDQQWQGPYDAIGHVLFYLEDVASLTDKQHFMKLYKQSVVSKINMLCLCGQY